MDRVRILVEIQIQKPCSNEYTIPLRNVYFPVMDLNVGSVLLVWLCLWLEYSVRTVPRILRILSPGFRYEIDIDFDI